MINFSKCSLTGSSFKLLYDEKSSTLDNQISYLSLNFNNSNAFWVPYKTSYNALNDVSLKLGRVSYSSSVAESSDSSFGQVDFSVDIKDEGDYVAAFKISKEDGISLCSSVSVSHSLLPGKNVSSYSVLDRFGFPLELDITRKTEVLQFQHNMSQITQDAVWITVEFSALVLGTYTFSISISGFESFDFINVETANLILEGFTVFKKTNFSSNGLVLRNQVSQDSSIFSSYRAVDLESSHPLSKDSFLNTLQQGEGRISGLIGMHDGNNFFSLEKSVFFKLSDFTENDRSVIATIPGGLDINENDLDKICIIFGEHYNKKLWHFAYASDNSGVSGKTFKLINNDLELQEKTISLDLFESDSKYKFYSSGSEDFEIKNSVVISPPVGIPLNINDITNSAIRESFKDNFSLLSDDLGNYYSLNLPDRHQAFVLDHSGSMSWSDIGGERFKLINDIVNRFEQIYPGKVSYSLTTFKGTPVIVEWFGAIENSIADSNDPDSVRAGFLQGKYTNFRGCHIVRKKDASPNSPTDGDIVFNGFDRVLYDTNLDENTNYYYAIYPIDNNNRLGLPSIIKAKTRSDQMVKGIKSLSGDELVGTGIRRDERSIFIYHMNEGYGNKIYDFSGNKINLTIPEAAKNSVIWLDESESPTIDRESDIGKGSGLRLTGKNSYCQWEGSVFKEFNGFNLSLWAYLFQNIVPREKNVVSIFNFSNQLDFKIGSESVFIILNGTTIGVLSHSFAVEYWNHISIDVDDDWKICYLYVNGNLVDSFELGYYSSLIKDFFAEDVVKVVVGEAFDNGFKGKVSEISFRNSSVDPLEIDQESNFISKDNGDRLLRLSWFTNLDNTDHKVIIKYEQESGPLRLLDEDIAGPANYGRYQGDSTIGNPPNTPPGKIAQSDLRARICYGDDMGPVSIQDGVTIFDSSIDGDLSECTFINSFCPSIDKKFRFSIDAPGFRNFFRIFRVNSNGEQSYPDDSGLLEYTAKSYEDSYVPYEDVETVKNVSVVTGNRKTRLKWLVPDESNIDSVVIYYSDEPFESDFLERSDNYPQKYPVFAGLKEQNSFTHFYGRVRDSQRKSAAPGSFQNTLTAAIVESEDDLDNGKVAYYAIVSRDRYGRLSSPVFVNGIPDAESSDSQIPPEEIIAARSYGVDYNTISLRWINPVAASRFFDIEGWLDDNVVLYFRVTDIYGRRIDEQNNFEIKFRFNDSLNGIVFTNSFSGDDTQVASIVGNFDTENRRPVIENISFSDLVSYNLSNLSSGWTRITVNTNNASLSDRNWADAVYTEVSMVFVRNNNVGEDPIFSFSTQPIRIYLKHPLKLDLITNDAVFYNPQSYSIFAPSYSSGSAICDVSYNGGDFDIGGEFLIYGAYNGRSLPYTFTVNASYKNSPLPAGSTATIDIFEDSEPSTGVGLAGRYARLQGGFSGIIGSNPELGTPASQAGLNAEEVFVRDSYPTSTSIQPVSNQILFENSPSGKESFGIGEIRVPGSRSFGRVFASVGVGLFYRSAGFYIGFMPTLYVKMNASAPNPDGEDVATQYAYAYVVDPNRFRVSMSETFGSNFSIENFSKPVPDGTTILWRLNKLRNAIDRPFYSTSQRSVSGSAIDKTVDGISQSVVFGPASNINSSIIEIENDRIILIPEEYIITATVSYNGVTSSAAQSVCIYPVTVSPDQVLPAITQTSFYFAGKSFGKTDRYVRSVYADGEDFAILEIIKDPRLLLSNDDDVRIEDIKAFCKCYNADGSNSGIENASLTILPTNQLIEIKANKLPDCQGSGLASYIKGRIEILHGSTMNYYVGGNGKLIVSSNEIGLDSALVEARETNRSDIAVRANTFIPLKWKYYTKTEADPGPLSPVFCNFINSGFANSVGHNVVLSASTSVIINGVERSVFSDGGIASGNPPKMIKFVEPLYMQFAYILKDGQKVNGELIEVDGASIYEFVFAIKFAGMPVPDGTEIKFYKCGSNELILESNVGYTVAKQEIGPWSYGPNGELETSSISMVSMKIRPISPVNPIFGSLFAEINYDKSGRVFRQRVAGIDFIYTGGNNLAVTSSNLPSTGSGTNNTGNDPGNGQFGSGLPLGGGASGENNSSGSFGSIGGGNSSSPPGSNPSSSLLPFPEIFSELENATSRLLVNTAFSNECYIYDSLVTDLEYRWRKIANMNLRRAMHVSEFVSDKLYSIGGLAGYTSNEANADATVLLTDTCEVWNASENRWKTARKCISKRFGCLSCADDRFIYVIGGFETRLKASISPSGQAVQTRVPYVSRRLERYDTISNTWLSMSPMPVFDNQGNQVEIPADNTLTDRLGNDDLSFDQYGCALGKAYIKNGKIIVLCGARKVDDKMAVEKYNDAILVYDILQNKWSVSRRLPSLLASEFCRLYPVVWEQNENIYIYGGSSSIVENINAQIGDEEFIIEKSKTFGLQNSFAIPLSDLLSNEIILENIYRSDYLFGNLPKSRDQVAFAEIDEDGVYLFGGRVFAQGENLGTNATRTAEKIISSNDSYIVENMVKPSFGFSNSGCATDKSRLIYITGGTTTNQAPGFVRLEIEAYGEQTEQINAERFSSIEPADATVRLDGFSGVDLKISAYDDEGEYVTGSLDVEISGLLAYGTGDDENEGGASIGGFQRAPTLNRRRKRKGTRVYPIVLNPYNVTLSDGIGYSRLEGRSEDVLKSITEIQEILNADLAADQAVLGTASELQLRQGSVRFPYRISIVGRVVDEFYFGKTEYTSTENENIDAEVFLPENEISDIIADVGDFDNATVMPPMMPAYASSSSPLPIADYGPVLTCSAVGVIGPIGDADLFAFIPPKSGVYTITIEQRGFSQLLPLVSVFNSSRSPYPINGTASNEIKFDNFGYSTDGRTANIELIKDVTYYFQVSTYAGAENQDINKVGAYRIRLTIPIAIIQNQNTNGSSSSSSSGNMGSSSSSSNQNSGEIVSFNIFEYLTEDITSNLGDSWSSVLRDFYNTYFRFLLANGGYSSQSLQVAIDTINSISSCPFKCPSCVESTGGNTLCDSGTLNCNGSDNTTCVAILGLGNIILPSNFNSSSSSSSFSSSSSATQYDPYFDDSNENEYADPYQSEIPPFDLPPAGSNELIIEDLPFERFAIPARVIFAGESSAPLTEGDSPVVQYYSDIDWIPEINTDLFVGEDAASDIKLKVRKIRQSIPFGSSPIYDGINESAQIIKSTFDSDLIIKNILLLSDNDENTSGISPLQVIENVDAIDGKRKVKINSFNISTFYPVTISAQASRANMSGVGDTVRQTGGSNFALLSSSFFDEAVMFAFTGSAGSAGAGKLSLVFDFDNSIIVNSVNPGVDTGRADSISYQVAYSDDGENYTYVPDEFDAGSVCQVGVKCKYIKIDFEGVIDFDKIDNEFSADPYDPYGENKKISKYDLSKIRSIGFNVSAADDSYIYLEKIPLTSAPQQVIIFVNWDGPFDSEVSAGVSTLDSSDWKDYSRDSQNVAMGSGKVIIPIRYKDKFAVIKEELSAVSPFIFELPHGSIHKNAKIDIYSEDGTLVDADDYALDRDGGLVRFQYSMYDKKLYSAIEEEKSIKIGVKASFGVKPGDIVIRSIGYMLTINEDLAPAETNQPPIAVNVRINPIVVYPYTNVTASYRYLDQEGDVEDVEKRVIKWYKNGIEIPQLQNIITFNDLHNSEDITYSFYYTSNYAEIEAISPGVSAELLASFANERIFEPGDQIYFTVQVHDGNQLSGAFRSPTVTVSDYPVAPSLITIRSRYASAADIRFSSGTLGGGGGGSGGDPANFGELANEFTNRTRLFLDFDLFAPSAFNVAIVTWYVIDNAGNIITFKSGRISDSQAGMYSIGPSDTNILNIEAVKVGHQIYAEMLIPRNSAPSILNDIVIRSNTVTITNIVPRVSSVTLEKLVDAGTSISYWRFAYVFEDEDIYQSEPGQSDRSILRLYFQRPADDTFSLETRITDPLNFFVPSDYYDEGTKIYLEVIPFDNVVYGASVRSRVEEWRRPTGPPI